jgi:hypothetical protein
MNAVLIAALILAAVLLIANTLLAVAFLRGRRGNFRTLQGRDGEAMDELHRRVQDLPLKRE